MKTYGVIFADGTKELISIVLDENDEPRMDTLAPYPTPDDWVEPQIIPLIKIDKPATRVAYDLQEIGKPDLKDVLKKFF